MKPTFSKLHRNTPVHFSFKLWLSEADMGPPHGEAPASAEEESTPVVPDTSSSCKLFLLPSQGL